jgi:hypothetical protein
MDTTQHNHDEGVDTGSSRPPDPAVAAGKPSPPRDSGEGDVLLGAAKIAAHLTVVLDEPVDADDVYYAHRMRKWPIGKYGALLIASKRRLNNHVEKMTRGPSAA